MSSKFRAVDRETLNLLPPSVQDWLPEDHLARFVVEIDVAEFLYGCVKNRSNTTCPTKLNFCAISPA